jgi:predicted aspartyl protease
MHFGKRHWWRGLILAVALPLWGQQASAACPNYPIERSKNGLNFLLDTGAEGSFIVTSEASKALGLTKQFARRKTFYLPSVRRSATGARLEPLLIKLGTLALELDPVYLIPVRILPKQHRKPVLCYNTVLGVDILDKFIFRFSDNNQRASYFPAGHQFDPATYEIFPLRRTPKGYFLTLNVQNGYTEEWQDLQFFIDTGFAGALQIAITPRNDRRYKRKIGRDHIIGHDFTVNSSVKLGAVRMDNIRTISNVAHRRRRQYTIKNKNMVGSAFFAQLDYAFDLAQKRLYVFRAPSPD